jgi:hypothetical protein
MRRRIVAIVVLVLIARHLLCPPILRMHTIDWTYSVNGRAVAGTTYFPLFILLDVGEQGEQAQQHELCHWYNALMLKHYSSPWDAELACGQDAPKEWYIERR